ncbi:MAG: DUF368 domain-containing protein [Flavobacteriales bacterium]|nr:DUF368 domain-containing protein [Flavobacteriales bacterium]
MKNYLIIGLKGMAMGAADVVPGVSGGTIAFISGIYERLMNAIKAVNKNTITLLFKGKIKEVWEQLDGFFLVSLVAGIGASVLILSKRITFLLETYPIHLWSFFFGLIIASALFVAGKIRTWNWKSIIGIIGGSIVAFIITSIAPAETPNNLGFIYLCGCIAICAMILPGISGSFILLIMGKYAFIMGALSDLNLKVILTFIAGCITGLLSFSRILSWMFRKQHDATVALLTGFMIGSLNKVWPWKFTVETFTDRHGVTKPLTQKNVWPFDYHAEPYLIWAIALCILGFVLVFGLEKLGNRKNPAEPAV